MLKVHSECDYTLKYPVIDLQQVVHHSSGDIQTAAIIYPPVVSDLTMMSPACSVPTSLLICS